MGLSRQFIALKMSPFSEQTSPLWVSEYIHYTQSELSASSFSSTEEANKSRNLFYGQQSFWRLSHTAHNSKLRVGPFVPGKKPLVCVVLAWYLSSFILQKAIWPTFWKRYWFLSELYIILRFIFRRLLSAVKNDESSAGWQKTRFDFFFRGERSGGRAV